MYLPTSSLTQFPSALVSPVYNSSCVIPSEDNEQNAGLTVLAKTLSGHSYAASLVSTALFDNNNHFAKSHTPNVSVAIC